MKLYDIKSRERRPVTVQMVGHVPNHVGAKVTRFIKRLDRTTGEKLSRAETMKFPPVIRWGAGETREGLPAEVLEAPALRAKLQLRRFIIIKEYESVAPAPPNTSVAHAPDRKRAKRSKAEE